uniref:Uncharacterized protein n=1 Tax=Thermorudis sp. TaxID=1969470 RepID=A0A7C3A7F4_9BACT
MPSSGSLFLAIGLARARAERQPQKLKWPVHEGTGHAVVPPYLASYRIRFDARSPRDNERDPAPATRTVRRHGSGASSRAVLGPGSHRNPGSLAD